MSLQENLTKNLNIDSENSEKVIPVDVADEMHDSFLAYAMSVIISRAHFNSHACERRDRADIHKHTGCTISTHTPARGVTLDIVSKDHTISTSGIVIRNKRFLFIIYS